jgi:hypothetical protein
MRVLSHLIWVAVCPSQALTVSSSSALAGVLGGGLSVHLEVRAARLL